MRTDNIQSLKLLQAGAKHDWFWALLIALLTTLAFCTGMDFAFMEFWDDGTFVIDNQHLEFTWANLKDYFTHPFLDLYTPLPMVSLMIDKAIGGFNPVVYHVHNLLLHIGAAIFLYLVIRNLNCPKWLAGLTALLWSLSPQKVESVIWITERKDVLFGFFAFFSCWAFLRAINNVSDSDNDNDATSATLSKLPLGWLWLCGITGVLSIWAKPASIPLIGIFIVYAIARFGKSLPWKEYLRLLAIPVGCTAVAILVSYAVTRQTNSGVPETFLAIPLYNVFWYPLTALWPWNLSPIFPPIRTWQEILPVVATGIVVLSAGVIIARVALRACWRHIICAILIIGGSTVPVLGMLKYTDFTHCDRYNYMVSGIVLAVAATMVARLQLRWSLRSWLTAAPLALLAAVFLFRTWNYIPFWQNGLAFAGYLITTSETPNRKAAQITTIVALKYNSLPLLKYTHNKLTTNWPPEGVYDHNSGPILTILASHIAILEERYDDAEKALKEIQTKFMQHPETYRIPLELIGAVYSDLRFIAKRKGGEYSAEAVFYQKKIEEISGIYKERDKFFPIIKRDHLPIPK